MKKGREGNGCFAVYVLAPNVERWWIMGVAYLEEMVTKPLVSGKKG